MESTPRCAGSSADNPESTGGEKIEGEIEDDRSRDDEDDEEECEKAVPGIVLIMPTRPLPKKTMATDVEAPVATYLHWIQRSPLLHAQQGLEMKREINQLNILSHKRDTPGDVKAAIHEHINHIKNNIQLWEENLVKLNEVRRKEFLKRCKVAGYEIDPFVQLGLLKVELQDSWTVLVETSENWHINLEHICKKTKLWKFAHEPEKKFDLEDMDLYSCSCKDWMKASWMLIQIFLDHVCEWIWAGESKAPLVTWFAQNFPKVAELPSDIENVHMSDMASGALSLAFRVCAVLSLLSNPAPETDIELSALDDLDVVAGEGGTGDAGGDKGNDLLAAVGRTVRGEQFWKARLEKAHDSAKVWKHYVPKFREACTQASDIPESPTQKGASKLEEMASQVEYLKIGLGAQAVGDLVQVIVGKWLAVCRSLVHSASAGESVDKKEVLTQIDNFLGVHGSMVTIAPFREDLAAAVRQMKEIKAQAEFSIEEGT